LGDVLISGLPAAVIGLDGGVIIIHS